MLKTDRLICGYHRGPPIDWGTHEYHNGSLTFLFGPNGAGKSTVLRTLAGLIPAVKGQSSSTQNIAFLPAQPTVQFGVTGEDVLDLFGIKPTSSKAKEILDRLEVLPLLHRPIEELSSGEAKRVLLAATVLRPTATLILDEPLAHLDWHYQVALQSILADELRLTRTMIIAAHEFNWCLGLSPSQAVVLHQGKIIARGETPTVLTQTNVQDAFRFRSVLTENPIDKKPLLALAEHETHQRQTTTS